MYKNFKIFSFLILSFLWSNVSLQAVGGSEVEEVPAKEVRRRGILRIQHADGSEEGTAVLFQEGQGWLGLGARHCFEEFHPSSFPMIACLGEEKRAVVKVYTPTKDVDLVLFVLDSPFMDSEGFPTLPEPLPDTSVYEGWLYGYGSTTSSVHPGSLENSVGICRKGKIFIAPLSKVGPDTHRLLNQEKDRESRNDDDFISFSSIHKKGMAAHSLTPTNKLYKFNQALLDRGCLPLKKNDADNHLLISPSFTLMGDSGGPVISEDNQIYALAYHVYANMSAFIATELMQDILKEKDYREYFRVTTNQCELSMGFVPGEEDILYIGIKSENPYSLEELSSLRSKIRELVSVDLSNYFFSGKSRLFHTLVKIEEIEQNGSPYIKKWVEKTHHYHIAYFISLLSHRNWVIETRTAAFQYIKEQLEIYSSDMKIPYFISLWSHLREGRNLTQVAVRKQLSYGAPPAWE